MIRSISWRVTVAYSSAWLLFFVAAHSGYTQPVHEVSPQKKITLHTDNLSAETVLQRIEALAQIHFLYSSSLIELNKPLPVSFQDRPLKEVLQTIGKQLGLELKMQGNYVILKKLAVPAQATVTSPPMASRVSRPVIISETPVYLPEPVPYHDSLISYRALKRTLVRNPDDFGLDTAFLRFLRRPVHRILKPAVQSRWHLSVGLFANDYAAGTEVHAGLRSLYVVANAGYMRSGEFRNGIGVGTSVRIKPALYFTPIYTYARLKREEDFSRFSTLTISQQHHNIKLQVSWAATRHLSFQFGPTFNVLRSHYAHSLKAGELKKVIAIRSSLRPQGPDGGATETVDIIGGPGFGFSQGGNQAYNMPLTQVFRAAAPYRADYTALKTWAGFEASVYYTINFYRRP
jgi:hypothetical protein